MVNASAQLKHVPKHTYTDIQAKIQLVELVMVGKAMDKLVVLPINMLHDGIVQKRVCSKHTYIYLTLIVIETQSVVIVVIRFQVRISPFDLQGIYQLVNGAQFGKGRLMVSILLTNEVLHCLLKR